MFLRSFEYFRATAIIFIVLGHCYGISGWRIDTVLERVLANLISGGTSLFVFISGFLFYHVFYPKFTYKKFMLKKIKNVYVPYLLMAFPSILIALWDKSPYRAYYFGVTDSFFDQILRPFFLYYLHGGVMVYWYIPFIMVIFFLSPIFIKFIQKEVKTQIYIVGIMVLISLLIYRPIDNISVIQSVFYFLSVYLIGILCSIYKEILYKFLKGKDFYLLGGAILLAVLQAIFFKWSGNPQKSPFLFQGIDISYVQKILLCLFFMIFLHRFEDKESKIFTKIAQASFAIYFLHPWMIYFLGKVKFFYAPISGFYIYPGICAAVIYASYIIARWVKKKFPEKSRMLIGW